MLLMLDLWDGISIKPMGVVRNPIDVAESLVRRNEPLTIQQGVVLWKIYNRALLNFAQSRDCPIAFFDRPGFADQVKSCTYRLGYGKGNAARFFEEQSVRSRTSNWQDIIEDDEAIQLYENLYGFAVTQ